MPKGKAKPFKCGECDWSGGSKSALTQHINKTHGESATAKLRNELGDWAPRPGGIHNPARPLRAAPSGVPSIDYAIGIGGVPKGRIVEIFGPPKIGKTFTAMTFSAHAQQQGGRVGYLDVENAMTESFLNLIPGLDIEALEFGQPPNGDQALEATKRFIMTGEYEVWTVDSLHACIPEDAKNVPIGSAAARAALARLLSEALPVLEHVAASTPTALILINHQKTKPGVQFGREWYTPGGSAPEYYSSVRLRVWRGETFYDEKQKVQIGHQLKVKVEASKVGAPFSVAEYDMFYREGRHPKTGHDVELGIDMGSQWYSILEMEGHIQKASSGNVINLDTGENLGDPYSFKEALAANDSAVEELRKVAHDAVYPEKFR